jgi:MtN3 and saliva related transmembrane protein
MQLHPVDLLGGAAALCSMVSFTPQVVKIWRERDASSVSWRMYAISVLGFGLWTTYGAMIGRWPLIACNAVCLSLCAAILVLKWRFDGRKPTLNHAS